MGPRASAIERRWRLARRFETDSSFPSLAPDWAPSSGSHDASRRITVSRPGFARGACRLLLRLEPGRRRRQARGHGPSLLREAHDILGPWRLCCGRHRAWLQERESSIATLFSCPGRFDEEVVSPRALGRVHHTDETARGAMLVSLPDGRGLWVLYYSVRDLAVQVLQGNRCLINKELFVLRQPDDDGAVSALGQCGCGPHPGGQRRRSGR